jgi:hypothetical protein
MVLEPIFERDFAAHSYGFRPNRGCKDALRRVQELLNAGYNIIVDVDLKSYFDTLITDSTSMAVTELPVARHVGASHSTTDRPTARPRHCPSSHPAARIPPQPSLDGRFAEPDPETALAILAVGSIAAGTQGTGRGRRAGILAADKGAV